MGRWLAAFVLAFAGQAAAQTPGPADASSPSPAVTNTQEAAPSEAVPHSLSPAPIAADTVATPAAPSAQAVVDAKTEPAAPVPAPHPAGPKVVEWINRSFTVPDIVVVREAPQADAPMASRLRAGASVDVLGALEDESWLQVRLPDSTIGYVRASAVPGVNGAPAPVQAAAPPPAAPPPAAAPTPEETAKLEGLAAIHDTSTLTVRPNTEGQSDEFALVPVKLLGLDGFGGEPRRGMEAFLDGQGNWVTCQEVAEAHHICRLKDGTDLAKIVLVNGAARTTPDAPPDYQRQQESAKAARRGIWRDGSEPVDAIPFTTAQPIAATPDEFVPGVPFAPDGAIPPVFAVAAPQQGLAFIDDQPFTLDEGIPAPLEYDDALGWGFWDRSFKWRAAPPYWRERLDRFHPRGAGLREVDLERHGYDWHGEFYRGPAVHASFAPGQPPLGSFRTPYAAAAFAVHPAFMARGARMGAEPRPGIAEHGVPEHGIAERGLAEHGVGARGVAERGEAAFHPGMAGRETAIPGRMPGAGMPGSPAAAFAARSAPNPAAAFAMRGAPNPAAAFAMRGAPNPAAQFAARAGAAGQFGSPAAMFAARQGMMRAGAPVMGRATAVAARPAPAAVHVGKR
jgi:hypothetical protein